MTDLLESIKKSTLMFSVMLVGQGGVGKSSILLRYTRNEFKVNMSMTVCMDFLSKDFKYKDKSVNMQMWDTSGQEIYKAVCVTRFKRSNAVIVVYDFLDQKSIQELDYWIDTAVNECLNETVFVVFGNKTDLVQNPAHIEETKNQVDNKLSDFRKKYKLELPVFVGNCKEEDNTAISEMMSYITQKLYILNEKKLEKEESEKRIAKERAQVLPLPQRKSIIIHQSDLKRSKLEKSKKKGFCF